MKKIIGTETEFGIVLKGEGRTDAVTSSMFLVNSYPYSLSSAPLWDYENENPLLDARGFEADGERERPGAEYNKLLNKPLSNGGRYYVDGAHPEYSTPECSDPKELVLYEKAGERILELSVEFANRRKQGEGRFSVYKNNTDHKGNSYGYHENYLVDRSVSFEKLSSQLIPFLVTRQIFTGSGKVGSDVRSDFIPYQISQRADFFEVLIDLNTMVKRPIINTRDEPHADPKRFRRLHVIVGDANMSEITTYLKVGTMALVLTMIEEGREVSGVELDDAVRSIKDISRDLTVKEKVRLSRGVAWSAIEIQREYLSAAEAHFAQCADPITREILERWRKVLDQLEDDPRQLTREIDWVIKLDLIESYMQRHECGWKDSRVAMMDLQYHDVVSDKGLYYALERGNHVERFLTPEAILAAQAAPPEGTRAYFRGTCLKKFPKDVYAASWATVLFNTDNGVIKKVPLMDPFKGDKERVGPIIEKAKTVEELLSLLAG
ncbi:MAG: proteasome accessory factor PafA2 [Nitrospirae bacterium]|nr:proteasome accessory factor PafA2 [Candidatus Troglogloeales bacterium]